MIPSADRDYNGPWRNRGYTFYIQMAYRDELTGKWAKLRALLDKYQLAFDDYWIYYYPKKKQPEKRPTVARRPLWQELDERFGVSNKSLGYSKMHTTMKASLIPQEPEKVELPWYLWLVIFGLAILLPIMIMFPSWFGLPCAHANVTIGCNGKP